jgi:hypothetical protein
MKTRITLIASITASCLTAGTFQFFPVPVTEAGDQAIVENIFQVNSSVEVMYLLGDLAPSNVRAATKPVEVNFPTIFITEIFSQWEILQKKIYLDTVLYGREIEGIPSAESYDYENGNGEIVHPVFGTLKINSYPWVYSPDYGWRYVKEDGVSGGSLAWWFWEEDIGWYWTTRNMFPLIFSDVGMTEYPLDPNS